MAESYTVDQFADIIRKKYPGAYDKKGNQDLVDAWVKKYPVYASRIKPATAATKPAGAPSRTPSRTQRRRISKSEFESNRPESTIASRSREAAIGVLEPFTLESLSQTIRQAGYAGFQALLGKPQELEEMAAGIVTSAAAPVLNLYKGVAEGDYDRAANAAGGFLSQTVPAVSGAVESVAGPVKFGPEIPKLDIGALRDKARTFAQNRTGASTMRTTEPIVKQYLSDSERAAEANAEKQRVHTQRVQEAEQEAADKTTANREKTAQQLETKREAEKSNARASSIDRSLKEGSQKLGERVKDLDAKLREEANEKYATVRQAVGNDPGVPLADLAQAAQYAEQNILKGSAENIKQFRELARKAPEDEGIVSGGVTFPPDSALYRMLQDAGAIERGGTIPFDQLQGYSSEIGAKLAKGGLPGDIYQALKYLKDKIDAAKQTIADRNGAGEALKQADGFWHSYMDLFYNSDSAISKVRAAVGTLDPEFYADAFTKGKAGDVAVGKLKQLQTRHAADASAAADLARNLRSAHTELENTKISAVKPVEPPKRVQPKAVEPPRETPSPTAPTADDIMASKRQKVRNTADTAGRMRSTTAFRTLTAPIRWGESWLLQRPAVLEWISKPTEADLAAIEKLPPAERNTLRTNIRQIIDRENSSGNRVPVSPALQRLVGQVGPVSGGVQNRQEALELLGLSR